LQVEKAVQHLVRRPSILQRCICCLLRVRAGAPAACINVFRDLQQLQTLRLPSAMRRSRLQSPQKALVMLVTKLTLPR
jgi:hypothetical protein